MVNAGIIKYLKEGLTKGYSIGDLKKELIKSGHSKYSVDFAANEIRGGGVSVDFPHNLDKNSSGNKKVVYLIIFVIITLIIGGYFVFNIANNSNSIDINSNQTGKDYDKMAESSISIQMLECGAKQYLSEMDTCYNEVIQSNDDISILDCDSIKGEYENNVNDHKIYCYNRIAIKKKDLSICDKIGEDLIDKYGENMGDCYEAVAVAKKDINICDKIQENLGDNKEINKYFCYAEVAGITGDISICETKVPTNNIKDICMSNIAVYKKDFSLCNNFIVLDSYSCIVNVARERKEISDCDNLNPNDKEYCIEGVALGTLNKDYCEMLNSASSKSCKSYVDRQI